jgi:GT2 family glycosyltransferase
MNIASVTVFCNEKFRLNDWLKHSKEYQSAIYKRIIVNNGQKSDNKILQEFFPKGEIIFSTGKSLIKAYNKGIKLALCDSKVDSILLIANDSTFTAIDLSALHKVLFNEPFHIVAPVIFQKDSKKIELLGQSVRYKDLKLIPNFRNKSINDIPNNKYSIVDTVPGGFNLAKREFYEIAGLQDEDLYMYSDEVDTAIKAQKYAFKIAIIHNIYSWHQHIDSKNKKYRSPMSGFYVGRNEILLARKHYNIKIVMNTFFSRLYLGLKRLAGDIIKMRSIDNFKYSIYFIYGVFVSIFTDLKSN